MLNYSMHSSIISNAFNPRFQLQKKPVKREYFFFETGTWSVSTSPARSPSPRQLRRTRRYGTTSLEQRSRSPSPGAEAKAPPQHSYPVLVVRRGHGRRLPPTPNKPSTLHLRPASINFPKLNASPTRCPLSYEQAVALGRGGRSLPSPVPNGLKPRGCLSDSEDDDDWC